ncbi:MAG TPA: radical SAM protein [Thermoanaerobaculia bacterium]|nr:radical SAM protein [Thermoanaerobaculia bacterium]
MSTMHTATSGFPIAPLFALDTLWFQVAGTLCNLQCTHCFISCSPTNHAHEMLTLADVKRRLREAEALGVKEYYFTGGEPFMNHEIFEILEETLRQGPASVLTNGLLIRKDTAARLKKLSDASEYSLDIRISIDGYDAATNDPIRGEGTFERILAGVRALASAGLNPVITVTEACHGAGTIEGRTRFLDFLGSIGLPQPRLKVMPLLRLGAEESRLRAYESWETLKDRELTPDEAGVLQCTGCRMVTSKGVYVCPILIDSPDAKMGDTLGETARPFTLSHRACFTCHETGFSCRT